MHKPGFSLQPVQLAQIWSDLFFSPRFAGCVRCADWGQPRGERWGSGVYKRLNCITVLFVDCDRFCLCALCSREMLKCTAFHPGVTASGVTVAGRPLRRFDRQWYGVSLSLITKSLEIVACIVLDFGNCCISTMEKHFVASCNKCTAVSLKKKCRPRLQHFRHRYM